MLEKYIKVRSGIDIISLVISQIWYDCVVDFLSMLSFFCNLYIENKVRYIVRIRTILIYFITLVLEIKINDILRERENYFHYTSHVFYLHTIQEGVI